MPHFSVSNAALRGGKCHTWMSVICGICFVQLWHLPCSSVAFGNNKPRIVTGMTTLG